MFVGRSSKSLEIITNDMKAIYGDDWTTTIPLLKSLLPYETEDQEIYSNLDFHGAGNYPFLLSFGAAKADTRGNKNDFDMDDVFEFADNNTLMKQYKKEGRKVLYVDFERLPKLFGSYVIGKYINNLGVENDGHQYPRNHYWRECYKSAMSQAELMVFVILWAWIDSENCWEELVWAKEIRKDRRVLIIIFPGIEEALSLFFKDRKHNIRNFRDLDPLLSTSDKDWETKYASTKEEAFRIIEDEIKRFDKEQITTREATLREIHKAATKEIALTNIAAPSDGKSGRKRRLETNSSDLLIPQPRNTSTPSNFWLEINTITGTDVLRQLDPFAKMIAALCGRSIDLSGDKKLEYTDVPGVKSATFDSDDGKWALEVNMEEDRGASFFLIKEGENETDVPSLKNFFQIVGSAIGSEDMFGNILPKSINDLIGDNGQLKIELFRFSLSSLASDIGFIMSYAFDEESDLANALNINAISQEVVVSFTTSGIYLDTAVRISVGDVEVQGSPPTDIGGPWIMSLVTDKTNPVTINEFIKSLPGINLNGSGIDDSAFSSNAEILDLSIGFGSRGLVFFSFLVQSLFTIDLGKAQISEPEATVTMSYPLIQSQRTFELGLMFNLKLGPLDPFLVNGILEYSSSSGWEGMINAQLLGSVEVQNFIDLSEINTKIDLSFLGGSDLDIGTVSANNPSFSYNYNNEDQPTFVLRCDGMQIEVGGEKKLEIAVSIPLPSGTGLPFVHVNYIMKDTNKKSLTTFSTDILVKGNELIETGLKLLGEIGKTIINKGQLTVEIEKIQGKRPKLKIPTAFIPDSITFGGGDRGLTLSNTRGYINFSKDGSLAFGAGGEMKINILGMTTLHLGGELSVETDGFQGSFFLQGEILIGSKIKLFNLQIRFDIGKEGPTAGGSAAFELAGKQGDFACEMALSPAPYPKL